MDSSSLLSAGIQGGLEGDDSLSNILSGMRELTITLTPPPLASGQSQNSSVVASTMDSSSAGIHSGLEGDSLNAIDSSGIQRELATVSSDQPSTSIGNVHHVVSNDGRVSPTNITSELTTNSLNNYEGGPTSTLFTHSYTSPFVPSSMFPSFQSQPLEFNHAINYVHKIKNRFQGQPDKYKQFLEILHTYQNEQRNINEGLPPSAKHLTEFEVYTQVSKLFENQDDLLQEFGQFLPNATNQPNFASGPKNNIEQVVKKKTKRRELQVTAKAAGATKRSVLHPKKTPKKPPKKVKLAQFKDISLSEASKYGTVKEYAFFEKVRQLLRSQDVYDNFLRSLALYNKGILTRSELVQICTPFLINSPELLTWFKEFIEVNEDASEQEEIFEEQELEIDFSTCKRLGASYCVIPFPPNHASPECSGRDDLCNEVLNDTWVSFPIPTWSEGSTFKASRKTQFEEEIYRCEDERFELDFVIETNASTIEVLEAVSKKISKMRRKKLAKFSLDDCLGGSSPTIHQRSIRRLYGDKAGEIIQDLKTCPSLAVPIVLRRLKSKEVEWREAQTIFNATWREQMERFYLKSLDHQVLTFKQEDMRALESKALINEIETLFNKRNEQIATGAILASTHHIMTLQFRDRDFLVDASKLLLHHMRRQSGIKKDDKRKIEVILKQIIPDLFRHKRMKLSDENEGSHDEQDQTNRGKNGAKHNHKRKHKHNHKHNCKKMISRAKKENGNGNNETSEAGTKGATFDSEPRRISKRELKVLSEQLKAQACESALIVNGSKHIDVGYLVDIDASTSTTSEIFNNALLRQPNEMSNKANSNVNESINMPAKEASGQGIIHIPVDEDDSYTLFYVNNSWYIFLRLYQILCERLTKMYDCAMNAYIQEQESNESVVESSKSELYPTFLEMVRNLLDGNMEMSVYEDLLREMFGIQAYIVYTMDKVIESLVLQLQTLVTDEKSQQCLDLFQQAVKQKGTGGLCATTPSRISQELAYQKKSEKVLSQENCIKVIIYKTAFQMTMELLENTESSQDRTEKVNIGIGERAFEEPVTGSSSKRKNKGISNAARAMEITKGKNLPKPPIILEFELSDGESDIVDD